MAKDTRFRDKKEQKIRAIQPTDERLTGRAGLALFEAYVRSIQILPLIDRWFGSMRKNSKGLAITELFVQLFCFFMDGASRHITWFDHLKADESYAGVIGSSNLASSHTIKRLFSKFSYLRGFLFRRLLQHPPGGQIDEQFRQAGQHHLLLAHTILAEYHQRGADELANRALKNFGHEQLPFKRFAANTAWYYMMCVSHNLFEAFKEDVSAPVISVSVYADTFRRQLIDTAGKIVRHAGKLIMKVPRATFVRFQFDHLFAACQNAPVMTG